MSRKRSGGAGSEQRGQKEKMEGGKEGRGDRQREDRKTEEVRRMTAEEEGGKSEVKDREEKLEGGKRRKRAGE